MLRFSLDQVTLAFFNQSTREFQNRALLDQVSPLKLKEELHFTHQKSDLPDLCSPLLVSG